MANTALKKLNLFYNGIGAIGAAKVGEALRRNCSLTELDLGYNGIGVQGVAPIAAALHQNSVLTSLLLFNTEMGDEGVAHFAEALRGDLSLKNSMKTASEARVPQSSAGLSKTMELCLPSTLNTTCSVTRVRPSWRRV